MKNKEHSRSKALLCALAALFSLLLLSTAVLPTVMSVTASKAIATAAPVEEEQMHGRDISKSVLHDHSTWDVSALCMRERMRASLRDRDEALPDGPISEVPVQPPKRG